MNTRLFVGLAGLCGGVILLGQLDVGAAPSAVTGAALGPDIIVGDLPAVRHWGIVDDTRGFSIATTACNVGDMNLQWQASTNRHPVVAQAMFRLHDGRLEQIGQSWVMHTFLAINNGICGQCNGPTGDQLGPGCSTPNSSNSTGSQPLLGPKSEINGYTGEFTYPYGICYQCRGNAIYKRLQVPQSEIDDLDDLYFIEGQLIASDDAQFISDGLSNGHNNASYRRITFSGSYTALVQGTTQRERPAIFAWKDHGLGVGTPDPDVTIVAVDIPDDGRLWIASKVSDNGDGTWRYDYAIQNLNSHRSGQSLSVPIPDGTLVTATYFHDVAYHSGEPQDGADWTVMTGPTNVRWATDEFSTNEDANALRWNTLYTYSFTADRPPATGTVTIGLFRPGTPNAVSAQAPVPGNVAEVICPDDPADFLRLFGGAISGDALDLCASDDVRLDVVQSARLSPLLPFIRLEFWAHATLAGDSITSIEYTIEGHVSALVAGGQNADTLRTSIRNYGTGVFELVDQRGTSANADETISHVQSANAPEYVNPGDGEVRARQDVFDPGNVFTPNWFLKVDLFEVTVNR